MAYKSSMNSKNDKKMREVYDYASTEQEDQNLHANFTNREVR